MVLADVFPDPLDETVGVAAGGAGHGSTVGVVTDVTDYESVVPASRTRPRRLRRRPPALQQRRRRRRGRGPHLGPHAERLGVGDWPSTCGVSSTASRPSCPGCSRPASRATSSTPRRATAASRRSRRRRSTPRRRPRSPPCRRCCRRSCARPGARSSASVLFPGPKVLRTGLFESWRNRPDRWANADPPADAYTTIESFERAMKDAGSTSTTRRSRSVAGPGRRRGPRRPVLDPPGQRANRRPGTRPCRVDAAPLDAHLPRGPPMN